ncbi:DUF4145 domain-containing protein [Endozoicomonas sp.]|uniref:DUF4145 domain-containing protein n=1 Tax=Endozoicomonas sp. TaxID=1892382 RepID=UPI00383AEA1A
MEKSLNFEMLRSHWPELANLGVKAEEFVHTDPDVCLVKLRNYLELIVRWLYRQERLPEGYRSSLYDLIKADTFQSTIPEAILMKMDALRIHGNRAAHGDPIKPTDAQWLLKEAFIIGAWIYLRYGNGHADDMDKFQLPEPPAGGSKTILSAKELLKKQAELEKAKQELEAAQQREMGILRELQLQKEKADEFQQRMETLRQKNEQAANILELDEAETRRRLIDSRLIAAGWDVAEEVKDTAQVTQEHPVKEQPTPSGDGYADYVLWDNNGKPLAVVEAKRTRVSAEKGRTQARLYADWLEKQYGQRPSFSTPMVMTSISGMNTRPETIHQENCLAFTVWKVWLTWYNNAPVADHWRKCLLIPKLPVVCISWKALPVSVNGSQINTVGR